MLNHGALLFHSSQYWCTGNAQPLLIYMMVFMQIRKGPMALPTTQKSPVPFLHSLEGSWYLRSRKYMLLLSGHDSACQCTCCVPAYSTHEGAFKKINVYFTFTSQKSCSQALSMGIPCLPLLIYYSPPSSFCSVLEG